MKTLTALLIWALIASAGQAQPVTIRTGEHADFTRVVLTIPPDIEWRFGRDKTGYMLQLPVVDGYDTRGFFDLIPRDRIADVSQDKGAGLLKLVVDCDCAADAFLYRPDILVIDVRDGRAAPGSPFEVMLSTAPEPRVAGAGTGFAVPRNSILPIVLPPVLAPPDTMPQRTDVPDKPVTERPEQVVHAPQTLDAALAALERAVTESLGRGLSQGLLEQGPANAGSGRPPNIALRDALGAVGTQAPGISASTSVDPEAIPPDPVVTTTQTGEACLPAAYFDVGSWGDDRSFQVQISEARAQLTQEFDRTDGAAVKELARRFLYFGFGREAEQVLQLDGVSSRERTYLVALARLIDGDSIVPGLFDQQVSCATPAALWAMLAKREGPMDAKVNREAVLRSFFGLPFPLQVHLGPSLAERFIAIGDHHGASQILSATRAAPTRPIAAELAEAALAGANGAPVQAVIALSDLAKRDSRITAEAMTDLLDRAVKNDIALDLDDFVLADALRFENAQLPVAGDLAAAQARALTAMGHFAQARDLIAKERSAIGDSRAAMLAEELAKQETARLSDAEFLDFAFNDVQAPLSLATENAIARRLLGLGFPDQASGMLTDEGGLERTYLRSQIALARGDPRAAIAVLSDAQTDKAVSLRRVAQDIASSDVLVPDLAVANDTVQGLWRRGAWDELAQSDDPLLQSASVAVLNSESAVLAPEAPLSSGRALLDRSAQSRTVLQDLFDRFVIPEDF